MSYAKKTEQGDILLTPYKFVGKTGFSGLPVTHVTLSRMGCTILWFKDFLNGKESTPAEFESDGKKYQAFRESDAIFLKEIRGNHVNNVAFYSNEIQTVLDELQQIMAEETPKEAARKKSEEKLIMDDDVTRKAILNGLADAMEKEADSITAEQQKIRDTVQPLGRILSEEEQERLNSLSRSAYEYMDQLRETAAMLRKGGLE
jgi:hypothetical protein